MEISRRRKYIPEERLIGLADFDPVGRTQYTVRCVHSVHTDERTTRERTRTRGPSSVHSRSRVENRTRPLLDYRCDLFPDRRLRGRNGRRPAVRVLGFGRRRHSRRSQLGENQSQRRSVARVFHMEERQGHTLYRGRLFVGLHD